MNVYLASSIRSGMSQGSSSRGILQRDSLFCQGAKLWLMQLERWPEKEGTQNCGYLMMEARQSITICFLCLEPGLPLSGGSSSKAFGSSLKDFFFGSSLE